MSLEALPGQAPGPQSTDQALPSWLTYEPYSTLTHTYTTTRQTVFYDPSGVLAPSVSVTVQVGVTTDTLYRVGTLPLLYTGPTPYPPLGTLFTTAGQTQSGSGGGSGSPRPTATQTPAPGPTAGSGSGGGGSGSGSSGGSGGAVSSSSNANAPAPTGSGSGSQGGAGPSTGAGTGGGTGASSSAAPITSAGTTFLPAGTSVVSGTTFLPSPTGSNAGVNPTSIISGTAIGPTSAPVTFSGSTFLPGGTTIFGGSTTVIDGSSTFINPSPSSTSSTSTPGGGGSNPLERQSGGLTPAQLAGTLVASIAGFLLLCALLLCCLLRRQRRREALSQGIGPEKYAYGNMAGAGVGYDADAGEHTGAGAGAVRGEKAALLGAGAAGAGAGAAAADRRGRSGWKSLFTSRGNNREPIDSAGAGTGGTYTALPQANIGPGSRHLRTGSGGSALSAGLAGASAAAIAAMATISSRRRRRREERMKNDRTPIHEDEWEADELADDGGSGFFVVGGRNEDERQGLVGAGEHEEHEQGGQQQRYTDPFADAGSSTDAKHRAEGIAAAAGAAVIAAGRGRTIPPESSSSLLVNDPSKDARNKNKYRAMANLGIGGGSGPRFFGAMMGYGGGAGRSASGTDSGTGSNSNSGPSQRNVSGSTHLTPNTAVTAGGGGRGSGGTQQPSVRSFSGPTYVLPSSPYEQSQAPVGFPQSQAAGGSGSQGGGGGGASGMMYGIGAAAGAAALGLANAARRISSGERRLNRKPVNYASSGTDTETDDPANPYFVGGGGGRKRKRAMLDPNQAAAASAAAGGPRGLYGAVGTGTVGEEDEDEDGPEFDPSRERGALLADYGQRGGRGGGSGAAGPSSYDVGAGWPEAALVGAGAAGAGALGYSRRSHRRPFGQGDAQAGGPGGGGASGSGSGQGSSGPWSSGSTHEVPKSSSGALLSGSSAGHRSGSGDELGIPTAGPSSSGGQTNLSPMPRPSRSRASTQGSPRDGAGGGLVAFPNVSSSSPQPDRVRLPAFPEGFGDGDLQERSSGGSYALPRFELAPTSASSGSEHVPGLTAAAPGSGPGTTAAVSALAAGTGGALGLLAAQHRTSLASMTDDNSQRVRTPDEHGSGPTSRHSNYLSRGTHLLGPGAAGSTRSTVSSAAAADEGEPDTVGREDGVNLARTAGVDAERTTVSEFGEQSSGPRPKSRATLGSAGLGRQLSTIFGSESEPSSGPGQPSSTQQHGTINSGSGSGSGVDSNYASLRARSVSPPAAGGSAGPGPSGVPSAYVRTARGSSASDPRLQPSLLSAIQRGQADTASPTGTFGVAELSSPPGSPRQTSFVGGASGPGGIRAVGGPPQSARASRSPTPGGAPPRGPLTAGQASADIDLEAADVENATPADGGAEGGLLSSVAAGLRRLGGGWMGGSAARAGGVASPPSAEEGPVRDRRGSIGVATMGARTATGTVAPTPVGRGSPLRPSNSESPESTHGRRAGTAAAAAVATAGAAAAVAVGPPSVASSGSSRQRPELARLSTATSQAVAGSREGSGSEPSAIYSGSLSSASVSANSAGLDSISNRGTSSGSGRQRSGSGSGSGSRRSRGQQSDGANSGPSANSVGAESGISYTTSELARRNTLSTHEETDEETLRRASMSGATSPALYTASEGAGASGDLATTLSRRSISATASPALGPMRGGGGTATGEAGPSTIRVVGGLASASGAGMTATPQLSGLPARPTRAAEALPIQATYRSTDSGSWRQSPRVATISQRAVEAQARAEESERARGSGSGDRDRSHSMSTGSPDEFEWGALANTFPTPLDRALREAEQRDLEEQNQGRSQTRYDWPKFLKF
ncbi:hypothetical protein V8E36_002708 [Tilletia maclaganii]